MVVDGWGEWLAGRAGGLLVLRGVDSMLRLVEKSLMWSIQKPQPPAELDLSARSPGADSLSEASPNGQGFVVMGRPLAWPLFFPLYIVLGLVRLKVYCVSRLIRRPCNTSDMIHWLQSKRRRLRAIKRAAIKNMHSVSEDKLIRTPNGTPCTKNIRDSTPDHERKRKYCDVDQSDWTDESDSEDEGVAVKLEKYCEADDSQNDPDFVPVSDDDSSEDEDSSVEDIEELEVKTEAVNIADESLHESPITSPIKDPSPIITVESPELVSDYASAIGESPGSVGSGVALPPLSPKSKFVKFFRRGSKTRHQH